MSRRAASSEPQLTAGVAMSGRISAVVVFRTAITEGGSYACEARIAAAAAGFADKWTAHSSINDRQGSKYRDEDRSHDEQLCIK